ncbi:MAG: DNA mismatch repair protein MutS, partial [Myxococcota bacterium]
MSQTPMFEQYRALKAAQPDAILFFRMGDFFEMFFEDAELAARELDLTLTSRNKNDPSPIPMAGVPHHAAPGYIQRLTDAGYRVAIAEQVEDPALAKGLVKREIVRVVTPGVVFDSSTLAGHAATWLAAITRGEAGGYGLAFLDATTGDLRVTEVDQLPAARAEIGRFGPRELIPGPGVDPRELGEALDGVTVSVGDSESWGGAATAAILGLIAIPEPLAAAAAAAVLHYARTRLGRDLGTTVHRAQRYRAEAFVVVDETSRRNLELFKTAIDGRRKGSLVDLLDQSSTALGSRRIGDWLSFPLIDRPAIEARLAAVEALVDHPSARRELRAALAEVADVARITARVAQGTANPRDVRALGRSLLAVPAVIGAVAEIGAARPHLPSESLRKVLAALAHDIDRTVVDEPPVAVGEGGLIREGVHPELDELVRTSLDGVSVIDALEAEERSKTGITSLKIRSNRVFGYYIEITTAHLHKVPDRFLRKQTLSNCERFVTPELKDLEDRVLGADSRRKALEAELFAGLRDRIAARSPELGQIADHLASLDALSTFAEVAVRLRWARPTIDAEVGVDITGGRHPMVEAATAERFVPNDVSLDRERQLVILTGPNMAGKSTVLRMVAIVALLAHAGSFVPAESARIGLCDRIFTRVGAADDLRRGRSTFMVEMSETATILTEATRRSLVVLDEIGRGTSTYDGLSIAWAVAEDLHDRIGCRAMFATHYHELCELPTLLPRAVNQQVAVSESGDKIVFLRR